MRWRALATGSISLIVLQVVLSSPQTGRLGLLFRLPAEWARRLIDPAIPAIPNLAGAAAPTTAAPPAAVLPGAADYTPNPVRIA